MRVLITGHQGYIGSALVPLLLERGHDVTGCDSGLYQRCRFPGIQSEVPDTARDIRALGARDLEGFDAVVHLAALSNDPLGSYRPRLTFEINREGTVHLARSAATARVSRFVFASSCSVYGAAGDALLHENSPFNPVTPYGESKADAEHGIAALASEDFSPTVIRAGTVYGVSSRLRFDLVLNNLVAWACATGVVRLKSDGRAWRPLVHVSDVARAYTAVLEAPRDRVHCQAFNVGRTRENYRVMELARVVEAAIPGTRVEFVDAPDHDRRDYRVDCDKIGSLLPEGKPRWTIEQGVEELHDALRRFPLTPEEFEGERFSRVAHIRHLQSAGYLDDELYWTAAPA